MTCTCKKPIKTGGCGGTGVPVGHTFTFGEPMTKKYKVGDSVTYIVDKLAADQLNTGKSAYFDECEMVSHKPAPEPIVGYITFEEQWGVFSYGKQPPLYETKNPVYKMSFDPTTKAVTAEKCDG